jgi:hypothetical protein
MARSTSRMRHVIITVANTRAAAATPVDAMKILVRKRMVTTTLVRSDW